MKKRLTGVFGTQAFLEHDVFVVRNDEGANKIIRKLKGQ
jgi:hypothetical protein